MHLDADACRDQAGAPKRDAQKRFTDAVIAALQEAEHKRSTRSAAELAATAWQALQFDFGVADAEELAALVQAFRCAALHALAGSSRRGLPDRGQHRAHRPPCAPPAPAALGSAALQGKSAWTPYLLTTKVLDNVVAGCGGRAAGSATASSSSGSGSTASSAGPEPQQAALYKQLYAAVVLQYLGRVLALPDTGAYAMLQQYQPDSPDSAGSSEEQPSPTSGEASEHPAAGQLPDGQPAPCAAPLAAEQDADDEPYEDMSTADLAKLLVASPGAGAGAGAGASTAPCSWPALQQKLLALAAHVSYACLPAGQDWRAQRITQQLLQLLRALGAHERAGELQPLLQAYVWCCVERLAAAPEELPLLEQLWEALGVPAAAAAGASSNGSHVSSSTASSGSKAAAPASADWAAWAPASSRGGAGGRLAAPLGSETQLALSVALNLGQRLTAASARQQLWHLVRQRLMQVLVQAAECLAYAGSQPRTHAPGGGGGARAGADADASSSPAAWHGELLSGCCLVGSLTEWLIMAAPRGQQPGELLISTGALRALTALFTRHAAEPGAEPLRRALLLAAASSAAAATWVAAVPGVAAALQAAAFREGGPFEAHGAVWGLLVAGDSGGGGALALVGSCLAAGADGEQLARLHAMLVLLADAHAAGRRRRLWAPAVQQQLQALAAALREQRGSAGAAAQQEAPLQALGVAANGGEEGASGVQAHSGPQQDPGDSQAPGDPKVHSDAGGDVPRRKAQQLQQACQRLLKELLTPGGSKAD